MSGDDVAGAVSAIAVLGDPTRRALYRYVAAQSAPVSREQAAAAVAVPHHVARFHLDKLHGAGLLEVEFKRPAGRSGPGAGHPTKLYRLTTAEYAVSVPERRYDIAGVVLTRAMAAALEDGKPAGQALEDAARDAGRGLARRDLAGRDLAGSGLAGQPEPDKTGSGPEPAAAQPAAAQPAAALAAAVHTLDACGFAPRPEGRGYVLGNCPFRALALEQPDVACRMNLALVRGLLDQLGVTASTARSDPADGRCCVTIGR